MTTQRNYKQNTSIDNDKKLLTNCHIHTISIAIVTDNAIRFGALVTIYSLLNQEETEFRIRNTNVERTIWNQQILKSFPHPQTNSNRQHIQSQLRANEINQVWIWMDKVSHLNLQRLKFRIPVALKFVIEFKYISRNRAPNNSHPFKIFEKGVKYSSNLEQYTRLTLGFCRKRERERETDSTWPVWRFEGNYRWETKRACRHGVGL